MDWMWSLVCGIFVGLIGVLIFYKVLRACVFHFLSASLSGPRAGQADARADAEPAKSDVNWMLDGLGGLQKTLLEIVRPSSGSRFEKLHHNFPRPKQISDYIYEVCNPTEGRPSVELVFFHGLQLEGSEDAHISTWLSRDRSELWLNWLLTDFPNARILIVSYDAAARRTDSEGITDMHITTENIVHDLLGMRARVGQDGCPVIFVGHCLGGLVMQEVCVKADSMLNQDTSNESLDNLLQNIKGFFYYATPHQGSGIADDANTEWPLGRLFKNMTVLNKHTARRNEDYRKLRNKRKWKTFKVGENRRVRLGNFEGFVVPEASARVEADNFVTVDADYFQTCQPESRDSSSFQHLNGFVSGILKEDQMRFTAEMDLPSEVVGLKVITRKVEAELLTKQRLGIVGMGGIGKTTLAKAVFDSISGRFEYACFLDTVKHSMTEDKQLSHLRKIIIDNLFCKGRKVPGSFQWTTLRKKTVLTILDDADSESQVNVMTQTDGFADESRLIVTSRNKGFLIPLDFEFYMAKGLSLEDSKELFCLHAFKERLAPRSHQKQVEKFAIKCAGLPLALKVAGRYLYSRKRDTWNDAFKKLGEAKSLTGSHEDGLWSVLRVSFDSLAEEEQKMFLDAATVFNKSIDLKDALEFWKGCSWAASSGWENLLDRCLVTLKWGQRVDMHEVLRDLGRSIACPDRDDITTHTRISEAKKVKALCEVLSARRQRGQGTTAKVEVLRLRGVTFDVSIIQDLEHLRILDLVGVDLIGRLEKFPNRLLVLSVNFLNSSVDGGMLEAIGTLVSLRRLKICNCGLTSFPQSFGQMSALESLDLWCCYDMIGLPDTICQLQALTELRISHCSGFKALPEAMGQLRALRYLVIENTGLETLPESFGQLGALRHLKLQSCHTLRSLPRSFGNLCALEYLCVKWCPCADKFSISAGEFQVLRHLDIQYNDFTPVAAALLGQVQRLPSLVCLLVIDILPISNYKSAGVDTCNAKFDNAESDGTESDLANFDELPPGGDGLDVGNESLLRTLQIGCHGWITLPGSLRRHQGLERLHVSGLRLEALPEYLGQLQALEKLFITDCNFRRLPESLGQLGALKNLTISRCGNLEALPESVGRLSALEELMIHYCSDLKILPKSLGELKALRKLRIIGCTELKALPESVGYLSSLELLHLERCGRMRDLPSSLSQLAPKCEKRFDRIDSRFSWPYSLSPDSYMCLCKD